MAVSDLDTYGEFAGNGATLSFAIPFPFLTNTNLVVKRVLIASPYTEILEVLGVGYSVTGGNPGTAVLFASAPSSLYNVRIDRNTPKSQGTSFGTGQTYQTAAVEAAVDKLTYIMQEINEDNVTLDLRMDVIEADVAAIDAAVTAAQLAETNAELAETNAETAEAAAVIAQVAAEQAQTDAEIAQAAAEAALAAMTEYEEVTVSGGTTTLTVSNKKTIRFIGGAADEIVELPDPALYAPGEGFYIINGTNGFLLDFTDVNYELPVGFAIKFTMTEDVDWGTYQILRNVSPVYNIDAYPTSLNDPFVNGQSIEGFEKIVMTLRPVSTLDWNMVFGYTLTFRHVGMMLIVQNRDATYTVTIPASSPCVNQNGDAVLGQYNAITYILDETFVWFEISRR